MNADLTISTLAFKESYSDKDAGSLRREVSRGVNLPTEMTIRHQSYTDSATKLPGVRSVLRFDRYVALSTGTIAPVSAYVVVAAPSDADVSATDIQAVVGHILGVLDDTSPNLDLGDNIFVNKEQ